MKQIWSIARTELQCLFYSPVAWILISIFIAQAATFFLEPFYSCIRFQLMNWNFENITGILIGHGILSIKDYLYLYLPLLTMGLISKEKSSGSIKLLYSAPISEGQIVLGKFIALIVYGVVLCIILFCFILFSGTCVENFDYPMALCGLFGFFLLFCAYTAIGIFVSSLFTNQVAVAMTTFAVLSLLNYAGQIGQSIPLIRNITYWLCLKNHTRDSMSGLLSSVDTIYFILIISLFLYFAILKVHSERRYITKLYKILAYIIPTGIAVLIGVLSTSPTFIGYWDMTNNKINTLSQTSQNIVRQLNGGLTVTSYVNLLDPVFSNKYAMPNMTMDDIERMKQYIRFKPEMNLRYVYYYADVPGTVNPNDTMTTEQRARKAAEAIGLDFSRFKPATFYEKEADLSLGNYTLCRKFERDNRRSSLLYFYNDPMQIPSEAEITGAILKLCDNQPLTGFLSGHGERSYISQDSKSWRPTIGDPNNRQAFANKGACVDTVSAMKVLPKNLQILVIADLQTPLTDKEIKNILTYIRKGGNIIIATEPGKQHLYAPLFSILGITLKAGTLIKATDEHSSDLVTGVFSKDGISLIPGLSQLHSGYITMPGTAPLEYDTLHNYKVIELCKTPNNYKLKTGIVNLLDKKSLIKEAEGTSEDSWCTMLALTRSISSEKEQRIIITGDADWLSNKELSTQRNNINSLNRNLSEALFYWLSDGYFPLDYSRPASLDRHLDYPYEYYRPLKNLLFFILPITILLGGITVCIIRKRK